MATEQPSHKLRGGVIDAMNWFNATDMDYVTVQLSKLMHESESNWKQLLN